MIHLDVPESEGEIHVKAGHLHGQPYYAVKVASGFYGVEPPAIDGLVMVFDAVDGAPAAFLLDGGYITDLRTGAAGGVAARHLAPERVERGRGDRDRRAGQAPGRRAGRTCGQGSHRSASGDATPTAPPPVRTICVRTSSRSCAVNAAASVEEAVEGADVVITCTAAREPLVRADLLAPGAHVTALGSDGAGKQELDPEILRRADVLVVDSVDQCLALGELQHAPEQAERAVELGSDLRRRASPGRTGEGQLTVCDLTGLGVQDVAAANVVMARAGDRGDTLDL